MAKVIALQTNVAVEIGKLYRRGIESWLEAGMMLTKQKDSMAHGEWLPWLEKNADALGFGERAARRLMEVAANRQLTADLWWNESKKVRGTQGTGDNEWYTPGEYVERARRVLGGIELDPASNTQAQGAIQADNYLTKADDGLTREWNGRVWLNPPYAQPLIGEFVAKLVEEYLAGRVPEAVMLTHNYTDTEWFQRAAAVASAICFTRGRIKFVNSNGELAAPTQGQAFFFFGDKQDGLKRFTREFENIGFVMVRP